MPQPIDLASHQMVALSRASLAALRAALLRDAGPSSAAYLQEAGYAGGEAVFASFRRWLAERGSADPEELELPEFERLASEYFRDTGWGTLTIGSLFDAVAVLDSPDWGEADPSSALEHPGCHLTTGMLADLFGRIADQTLAVLEVECRSMGSDRCRFLIGNADVLVHLYEEMARGVAYEQALQEVE
jgi:predicted hydrocarbon binding protein